MPVRKKLWLRRNAQYREEKPFPLGEKVKSRVK